MINKNTLISDLPLRLKLIAYCYTCERSVPVDQEKFQEHTLENISTEMHCPVCDSGNMGIRPILINKGFSWRTSFSILKSKFRNLKILPNRS